MGRQHFVFTGGKQRRDYFTPHIAQTPVMKRGFTRTGQPPKGEGLQQTGVRRTAQSDISKMFAARRRRAARRSAVARRTAPTKKMERKDKAEETKFPEKQTGEGLELTTGHKIQKNLKKLAEELRKKKMMKQKVILPAAELKKTLKKLAK